MYVQMVNQPKSLGDWSLMPIYDDSESVLEPDMYTGLDGGKIA